MPRTPLLSSDPVLAAAANNADWCELVCRANAVATQRNNRWWSAASRSPAQYPDAVTLTPTVKVRELLGTIDNTDGASVKDSYGTLELAGGGFRLLFKAHWISRPPPAPAGTAGPAWDEVSDPHSLREWADAHGIGATLTPAVLADPAVVILRRRSAGRTDGGAIGEPQRHGAGRQQRVRRGRRRAVERRRRRDPVSIPSTAPGRLRAR